jgi:hypothetical protein
MSQNYSPGPKMGLLFLYRLTWGETLGWPKTWNLSAQGKGLPHRLSLHPSFPALFSRNRLPSPM